MTDAVYLIEQQSRGVPSYYSTRKLPSGHGRRVTYAGTRRWVLAEVERGRAPSLPWREW